MSASQPMMLELENQRNYVAGSGNGVQFAVCLDQGGQKTMEDCHSAVTALDEPFSCWSFFAVYDGHEGNAVSQWSAVQLPRFFLASHEMSQLYKEHLPASERDGLIRRGLLKGFNVVKTAGLRDIGNIALESTRMVNVHILGSRKDDPAGNRRSTSNRVSESKDQHHRNPAKTRSLCNGNRRTAPPAANLEENYFLLFDRFSYM